MTPRITTAIQVSALVRRVNAEGGAATVLRKGDETAGSILLLLAEKGRISAIYEPALTIDGSYAWRKVTIQNVDNKEELADSIYRRQCRDPDLWVVELDIAHPERFIAD